MSKENLDYQMGESIPVNRHKYSCGHSIQGKVNMKRKHGWPKLNILAVG